MRFAIACLIALTAATAARGADLPGFPQDHADKAFVPDPSVRFGVLANGVRYCVMPNHQPVGKASLRLQVQNGSLVEDDAQQGIAHFLEHTAFNGSTHFPPGKLIEYLQSIGLSFGADTNAGTGFDETTYKLDMPNGSAATVATGLTVLADYAGSLLILPEQIDRERGVILAEMRDRNTPSYREWVALMHHQMKGARLPDRMPIGTKETVAGANAKLMRSFYDDWYRPEWMVVTAVGDIDSDAVIKLITDDFAQLTDRSTRARQPFGAIEPGHEVFVLHEPEDTSTIAGIELSRIRPRPHWTMAEARFRLLCDVASRIFARRMSDIAEHEPQGPVLSGSLDIEQWMDTWNAAAEVQCRTGKAVEALGRVELELRRYLAFGPTPDEVAVAVAALRSQLDQSVAQALTRTNGQLAGQLYNTTYTDEVFMTPSLKRDLYVPLIEAADPAAIKAVLAAAWELADARVVDQISGREDLGANGQAAAAAAIAAADKAELTPPVAHAEVKWAYGEVADSGSVLSDRTVLSDAHEVAYANHALANIKHTDFQPNQVLVALRLQVAPVARAPGLSDFAGMTLIQGGLGKHSIQEIQQIFASSSVRLRGPGFDDDGATLMATCLPKDLDSCLQQLRAYITDPGWRDEAASRLKSQWLEELTSIATDLDQQVQRALSFAEVDNAPQRRPVTLDEAKGTSLDAVRAWFNPILAHAPLELTVVGDVDYAAALASAKHWIGSLPERQPHLLVADPEDRGARVPCPAIPAKQLTIEVPGKNPRALVMVAWPTSDTADHHRYRRLQLLGQAMTEKLREKVRVQLGDAYSPYAYQLGSEVYAGFGAIPAVVGVAPDKAEVARAAVLSIADDLIAHGVDDTLLTRVKEPVIKNLTVVRQRNEYWLQSVLLRAQENPFRIDLSQDMVDDFNAVSAGDLNKLAQAYLDNAKALQVVGICRGAADAAKPDAPAPAK